MREQYKEITFQARSRAMIDVLNQIINDYISEGYRLTVRQLYYQCVSRDIFPNSERSYQNLITLVTNARLAGLMDWDAIEDRTRSFIERSRWNSPKEVLTAVAQQYHTDPWKTQEERVFLVVEKEALVGVFEDVCHQYDVPLLAARGYPSASVMRQFANEHILDSEQRIIVMHFGDHDPSGIDMTRDLVERIDLFSHFHPDYELHRMALNRDQIDEFKPPPNPAKMTDSRFVDYRRKHGTSSWELDALPPSVLTKIAETEIRKHIDHRAWAEWGSGIEKTRRKLYAVADKFGQA